MDTITDQLRANYDALPYAGGALRLTHPDNLSAVATVSGLSTAPVERCRVLEIGCGQGRNLIPMAATLPGSRFVGIDLSPRQIEAGRMTVAALGLTNIELRAQNLMEFPSDGEPFDFILAHGIYSWVPPEVRDGMLALVARQLAPQGAAYVSYNTYPGWHLRRVGRDLMLFHGRRATDPAERVALARQILALAAQAPQGYSNYKDVIDRANSDLADASDWYLFHDFLERVNHPVYFEQFVQHAAAHRLMHLGDARPSLLGWQWLPDPLRDQVMRFATNDIEREQYLDFLCGRSFRSSLLCRPEAVRSPGGAAALTNLFVAGAKPQLAERGAVFRRIVAAWPRAVSFAELTKESDAGGAGPQIVQAYLSEVLELWTRPTDFIATPTDRPRAAALARHQAAAGGAEHVVNLRHESISSDPLLQYVLPLLDGTRDRAMLVEEMKRLAASGTLVLTRDGVPLQPGEDTAAQLDWILQRFANQSLLAS